MSDRSLINSHRKHITINTIIYIKCRRIGRENRFDVIHILEILNVELFALMQRREAIDIIIEDILVILSFNRRRINNY